ncbi:MAG: hypothetical protein AUK24_01970 [Syntrophaceae bacterium CG2_30_49_12]|nr:MAG: hypothetical protein AUK24_01970 [Syntrophaceae bacterium CG2_30_49_12]PIP06888.1 MAG: hypothetical protein COX52_05740 [Syntrophobacterales bacterium CG23_combo_of_CG06-09_8_20_14_all_48_27]
MKIKKVKQYSSPVHEQDRDRFQPLFFSPFLSVPFVEGICSIRKYGKYPPILPVNILQIVPVMRKG